MMEMKDSDWNIIKFFKRSEFRHPEMLKLYAVQMLDHQRQRLGYRIDPSSDGRPPDANKEAGGVSDSLHPLGEAFDCKARGLSALDFFLKACELPWTEIGLYEDEFVHLGFSIDHKRPVKRFYGFNCPFCEKPGNSACPHCKGRAKIYRPISEEILKWHLGDRTSAGKKAILGIP